MLKLHSLLAIVLLATVASSVEAAVFVHTNRASWEASMGTFPLATIDFTGFPDHTLITDQYSHLGVTFSGQHHFTFLNPGFLNDGAGLESGNDIELDFDQPIRGVAMDFPGLARIHLYIGPSLIYTSQYFSGPGFVGLVASPTFAFDRAVIDSPGGGAFIDDLHFGPATLPAAPVLVPFALVALIGRRRRGG